MHHFENTSHESIKKGLQKIKEAQIEVMRELGKDDSDYSRNHSLTYSKETTYDNKPAFWTDGDAFKLKNKPLKVEAGLSEFSITEGKFRQESNFMGDEIRKYKEAVQKAEAKMKEYEQSEEKALNKAQNAYSNAIASEKKYINLKGEFDKINKERDRLSNDLKKLQRKELSNFANILEKEGNIPNKIVKELIEVHDCLKELISKVNSHKCSKASLDSKNSPNTSLNSSANSFTISTFSIQDNLDKNMAKLIGYFKNLQSLGVIQNNLQNSSSGVYGELQSSNHYLSNSFQEDIRLIEEEIQKNTYSRHDGDPEEVVLLQNKIRMLTKENEENNEIKNEYESFKIKTKERELQKDLEIEIWKKKQRMAEDSSRRSRNDSDFDRNSSRNSLENVEDRLQELERENRKLTEKLSSLHKNEEKHMQTIEKLKLDLELTNATKQEFDTEHSSSENKVYNPNNSNNAKNNFTASSKTQHEWEEMVELVKKLSEEKQRLVENERKTDELMQEQNLKYQEIIQEMEAELKSLRKEIQELQNTQQRENNNRIRNEEVERKMLFTHQPIAEESSNLKEAQFTQNNYHRQNIQPQYVEQVENRHYIQYNSPTYEQQQQQQVLQQVQQLSEPEQFIYNPVPPHNKIVMGNEIMSNAYGHVQSYGNYPVHYQVQHPNINQGMIIGYGAGGNPVYR